MSYKLDVEVNHLPTWKSNGLRFATRNEVDGYKNVLLWKWTLPTDYRITESSDPANYKFDFVAGNPVPLHNTYSIEVFLDIQQDHSPNPMKSPKDVMCGFLDEIELLYDLNR